jgi:hypothetical protein
MGWPHVVQKAVAKLRASGKSKRASDCSPRSHRSAEAFTITSQECAVPVAFRQREQWQFRKRSNGPSTSNATSPHRQPPRNAAFSSPRPVREAGSSRFFRFGAKEVAESGVQARCPRGAGGTRSTQTQQTLQRPARRESRKTGRRQRVRVSRCRSSRRHQRRRQIPTSCPSAR